MSLPASISYYERNAKQQFTLYESLTFSDIHADLIQFLPSSCARCLDVGAGSGRDAAALARRGYQVVALEPSETLMTMASQTHREPIVWIQDTLPAMREIKKLAHKFDFVLLSAVWMHIPPELRPEALQTLAVILETGGKLALLLRIGEEQIERGHYGVSANELIDLAQSAGFNLEYTGKIKSDRLGRAGVSWQSFVFSKV